MTETGHDWISRSIPLEISEIEDILQRSGSFETFMRKTPLTTSSNTAPGERGHDSNRVSRRNQ